MTPCMTIWHPLSAIYWSDDNVTSFTMLIGWHHVWQYDILYQQYIDRMTPWMTIWHPLSAIYWSDDTMYDNNPLSLAIYWSDDTMYDNMTSFINMAIYWSDDTMYDNMTSFTMYDSNILIGWHHVWQYDILYQQYVDRMTPCMTIWHPLPSNILIGWHHVWQYDILYQQYVDRMTPCMTIWHPLPAIYWSDDTMYDNMTSFISNILIGWHHVWQYDILYQQYVDRMTPCMTICDIIYQQYVDRMTPFISNMFDHVWWHHVWQYDILYQQYDNWSDDTMYDNMTSFISNMLIGWHHVWQYDILYQQYIDRMTPCMTIWHPEIYWSDDTMYDNMTSFISMHDNMTSVISNMLIGWHHVWQYDILYQKYIDRMTPCMTIWHPLSAIYWSDDTMYDNMTSFASNILIGWHHVWQYDILYQQYDRIDRMTWHHVWQYDILYQQYIDRMTPCMTIWHPLSAIYWSDDTMYDNMTSFASNMLIGWHHVWQYDILYQQYIDRMTPCMTIWHPLPAICWSDDTMYDNMTSFISNIMIGWHHVWQCDILYQQYIDRMTPCMTIWHPLPAIYLSDDTMYDMILCQQYIDRTIWHPLSAIFWSDDTMYDNDHLSAICWSDDTMYDNWSDDMTPCMTIWHPLSAICWSDDTMYDNMTSFISNILIGWHHVWQYDILYQQYIDRMTPCMTIWHPLPAIYWSDDISMYDNMTSFISNILIGWHHVWQYDILYQQYIDRMTPCMTIWHDNISWSDDTMYDNMTSFISNILIGWHHVWQYDILYQQYVDRMTPCMTIWHPLSAIYWSDDTMYDNMTSMYYQQYVDRMTPCMTIWHPLSAIYWSDDTMYDNMTSVISNMLIGWHHVWQYDILYQQYIDRMTPCMTIWHPAIYLSAISAIYWSDDTMYDNMTSFISNILIGWHHVWQYDILYQQYVDRMTPCMTIWHPLSAIYWSDDTMYDNMTSAIYLSAISAIYWSDDTMYDNMTSVISNILIGWHHVWQYDILYQQYIDRMTPCMTIWHPAIYLSAICQQYIDRMTPCMTIWHPLSAIYWSDDTMYDNMTSFISNMLIGWHHVWQYDILYQQYIDRMTPCMTIWHPLSAIYWSDDIMYDNVTSFISNILIGWHHVWQYDILYQQYVDRMTPCMTIWHPLSAIYWSDDTMYDNMTSFISNILIGWHHVWQYDILYQQYIDRMTPCMTIWHPLSAIYWSDDTMYDNMTSFISNILIGYVWQLTSDDRMTPCMTIWHPLSAIYWSDDTMYDNMTSFASNILIGWHHVWQYDILYQQYIDRMTPCMTIWHPLPAIYWSDDTMYDNMTSFISNILIGWHHVWQYDILYQQYIDRMTPCMTIWHPLSAIYWSDDTMYDNMTSLIGSCMTISAIYWSDDTMYDNMTSFIGNILIRWHPVLLLSCISFHTRKSCFKHDLHHSKISWVVWCNNNYSKYALKTWLSTLETVYLLRGVVAYWLERRFEELGKFIHPPLPVYFAWDTDVTNRVSLRSGVYARGCEIPHTGGKCVVCRWLHNIVGRTRTI